jgi:hypothetical protein
MRARVRIMVHGIGRIDLELDVSRIEERRSTTWLRRGAVGPSAAQIGSACDG